MLTESTTPPRLIEKRLKACHNHILGHRGVQATLDLYQQHYGNEPGLLRMVKAFIEECPFCQKIKDVKEIILTKPFVLSGNKPMDKLSLDSVDPLETDVEGFQHILVIIDNFTRFVELYPIKDLTGELAAQCLIKFVGRYGTPSEILHDKGTQFENEMMQQLLRLMGTEKLPIIAGSKQQNAIAERS